MPRAAGIVQALSLGFVALIVAAGPSLAASSIKVKVDDQPITTYDIDQRSKLLRLTGDKGGAKAATEELIDETLQFIEAAKRGVSVSDARVDMAIASISQNMKISPAQLKKGLGEQGIDIVTLRRRIKSQMIWQQLVQAKLRFEKSVKASDVTQALFQDGKSGDKMKTTEFTLQQIIFVVPGGSSAAFKAQRRREAEAFRLRFPGCDNSVAQAKQLKGVVVKSLGRRTSEDLVGDDGAAVKATPIGKTTRPSESTEGFDLIAVCSTRELSTDAAARTQVENKLLMEKNKELGKEYLADLRKKAVIEYR